VPGSSLQLQRVSGDVQLVGSSSSFQNIIARVTDSLSDPVQGATVVFQAIIGRTADDTPILSGGDNNPGNDPVAIILGSWQQPVVSDGNGLVTLQPSTGGFTGDLVIMGSATAGSASLPFVLQSLGPP